MLHSPIPLHPIDPMSHIDLPQHCMPLPSPTTATSRPRARQVFDRLKRQASALVLSPSRRLRSASFNQSSSSASTEDTEEALPTVTLISATSVHSSSSCRSRSISCAGDDGSRSTPAAILRIDAPPAGDFAPYLPLAVQLERERGHPYAADRPVNLFTRASSALPPVPPSITRRSALLPSSPSLSERSDSTVSTRSPATPVFPHHHDLHPYVSLTTSILQRWSIGSDDQEQNSDPFAKSKAQAVRRSLIQDSFLLACAAADDVPPPIVSPLGEEGTKSPQKRLSAFKKKSNASLPPLKPPPSCPLPSPPLTVASDDSDGPPSSPDKSHGTAPAGDEEWTLFLGSPSQPLELPRDASKKESARGRSGSSPSVYSTKQHLSPEDIPPQIQQQQNQPRLRTVSHLSNATTRRIESGPAPNSPSIPTVRGTCSQDWTLSLPLLKKPKSSLCIDPARNKEPQNENKARKCKSFAEWTTNLPDALEKLRELEREQKRERKISKVSIASNASQHSVSQCSVKLKRQLPIGPAPSSPCTPSSPSSATGTPRFMQSKSTASLRSTASTASLASTSSYVSASGSLHENNVPHSPSTPSIISPSLRTATPTFPGTISASTSVSTLGKFPLPPSFSSKLLQRRQAVPPMPKPLLPACSFSSIPPGPSTSSPFTKTNPYLWPIDQEIASAPATTSCFPSSPSTSKKFNFKSRLGSTSSTTSLSTSKSRSTSRSREPTRDKGKGKSVERYCPPPTASSTTSSSSSASSVRTNSSTASSVRTNSSTATIVPNRTQQERERLLMARVEELEAKMVLDICSSTTTLASSSFIHVNDDEDEGENEWVGRDSLDSSIVEGEFDTCTEGGFSMIDDRVDAMSVLSGAYYSARSSLSM